jgi:hypothetical protein
MYAVYISTHNIDKTISQNLSLTLILTELTELNSFPV